MCHETILREGVEGGRREGGTGEVRRKAGKVFERRRRRGTRRRFAEEKEKEEG